VKLLNQVQADGSLSQTLHRLPHGQSIVDDLLNICMLGGLYLFSRVGLEFQHFLHAGQGSFDSGRKHGFLRGEGG
jgi:hypothetical protein